MPVNLDKATKWKTDIALSVDMYNVWFMEFAPVAFRNTRLKVTVEVEAALKATDGLRNIQPALLRLHPGVLRTLRMSTCPPIAVDRLIGLSGVTPSLVRAMELTKQIPPRMVDAAAVDLQLGRAVAIIERLADPDIFVWLNRAERATKVELRRAATIVADRLCGAVANPIIRNAQEKRQLAAIKAWLEARGYTQLLGGDGVKFNAMQTGTFSFRLNVPVKLEGGVQQVNIPSMQSSCPKALVLRTFRSFSKRSQLVISPTPINAAKKRP